MSLLSETKFQKAREFIYRHGRLLERKLFEFFFEAGSKEACLRALSAYQNADGGFGNGLEPDLLCPDSSAIGAETALYTLDLLEAPAPELLGPLAGWIASQQNEAGFIPHPPENMANYPYQPWWANPDDARVLALAGLLKKWEAGGAEFYHKARRFYESQALPAADNFYGYPIFIYLLYCGENDEDHFRLEAMRGGIPTLLARHGDHFPLFGRHWFYAYDAVSPEVLQAQARAFVAALQEDGGLATPYPDLPWWRPIWTLDGLILMKKRGMI